MTEEISTGLYIFGLNFNVWTLVHTMIGRLVRESIIQGAVFWFVIENYPVKSQEVICLLAQASWDKLQADPMTQEKWYR